MSFFNFSEASFEGVGKYGFPKILPTKELNVSKWCMFETVRKGSCLEENKDFGVHFFQDDHKFESVWTKPNKHLERLLSYGCVLAPDFSLYTDFPVALQIMQTYKRHWVARYWQEKGIKVIPTINWSTQDSYEWCFDGEPCNSIVAVGNVGLVKNKKARELFDRGFEEMKNRLTPSKILFFTYEKEEYFKYKADNVEFIDINKFKNLKQKN